MRTSDQPVSVGEAAVRGPRSRSGPRAPAGKRPLTVLVNETVIEEAKIKAIREKTNLSRVTQELLRGWLNGTYRVDGPSASQ